MKYSLSRHPPYPRRGMVGVGVIQAVEDHIGRAASSVVIHIVREIVEVEQIGEEVVADAKLGVGSVGVAHGGEKTSFQPVVLCLGATDNVGVAFEQPARGLAGYPLAMSVDAELEAAVGNKVWKDEFPSLGGGSGGDCVEQRHSGSKLTVTGRL